MNPPEAIPPIDEEQPVFAEPWHAQIFALAHSLSDRGVFTWSEWAQCFSRHLAQQPDTDGASGYYNAWLAALEELVSETTDISAIDLKDRKDAWDRAARKTPHGQPIVLD